MTIQDDFARFLDTNGLSQASVSRSIGVSGSALSQWMGARYKGDCSTLERKISDFMGNYNPRSNIELCPVVTTANIQLSHFVMGELIVSRKMGAIYGAAGCGKTTMIREFVRTHPEAIVIEAVPGMQMATALGEIADKIGVQSQKNMTHIVRDIAKKLSIREAVLIVDEAENLTTSTLEALRRIWDFSGTPTALVGTYALLANLKGRNGELLQLYSRISRRVEFAPLGEEEWEQLFGEVAPAIARVTENLRIAANLYETAARFASMKNEPLHAGHIKAVLPTVMTDR